MSYNEYMTTTEVLEITETSTAILALIKAKRTDSLLNCELRVLELIQKLVVCYGNDDLSLMKHLMRTQMSVATNVTEFWSTILWEISFL
jgi:hypothetical protein